MELEYPESLKGHFLMAMPALNDPNFFRSVTFLCEHTQAGAVGIIVNRVHDELTQRDIFTELDIDYLPQAASGVVYIGGPVHANELFVLHGPPFDWRGCLTITPTLAMSNTSDILKAVAEGKGPKAYLITLGCAGWGPGQLEGEIKRNDWLTSPVDEEIMFELPVESKWEAAIKRVGVDPAFLIDSAGHA